MTTRTIILSLLGLWFWACQAPKEANRSITACVGADCDSLQVPPSIVSTQDLEGEKGIFTLPRHIAIAAETKFSGPQPTDLIKIDPPAGMIYVPGGQSTIGSDDGHPREQPAFQVIVPPFFLDKHPVSVADFRAFVAETGYQTEADTFGNAGVFNKETKDWALVDGANWEYPQGPKFPKAKDDHPVTQVSWRDAHAYAQWAGKRLVFEFEWEHAARNGVNSQAAYPWGDDIQTPAGDFRANIWNGRFPYYDNLNDGFAFTSPIGLFGETPLGLTDMTGNVWEWTADWRSDYRAIVKHKPQDETTEKVIRGGSFLCEPSWCHGYRVSGRSFCTPETALMHTGFRCAQDIES